MREEDKEWQARSADEAAEGDTRPLQQSGEAVVRDAALKEYAVGAAGRSATRRYNLAVSEDLMLALQDVAKRQGVSVAHVLRKFIKLGLFMDRMEGRPDVEILIKEGGQYQRLVLF